MPLTKLQFKPGVNRETTSYTNEGGWFDVDKVRFRFGLPEKIGGWLKRSSKSFLGTCRALHPWVTLSLGDLSVKILVALIMLVPFRLLLKTFKPV